MTFDEYQKKAISTDVFGGERSIGSQAFFSKLLGLAGETGEIADKFKKIYRDNEGKMSKEQVMGIKKELGDVLWYLAVISEYLDLSFAEVAELNIEKLASRKARGKIAGSGDNR